jgi:hypothetical protein
MQQQKAEVDPLDVPIANATGTAWMKVADIPVVVTEVPIKQS